MTFYQSNNVASGKAIVNNNVLLENSRQAVDSGQMFGALLTDLSTAFDCLDNELLIAKLNAHGFSLPASKLVYEYLSKRKEKN